MLVRKSLAGNVPPSFGKTFASFEKRQGCCDKLGRTMLFANEHGGRICAVVVMAFSEQKRATEEGVKMAIFPYLFDLSREDETR